MFGQIDKILLGWSADEQIRYMASSGGFIKSFLCHMIDKGYYAIITRQLKTKPEVITTNNKDHILDESTNSIYNDFKYNPHVPKNKKVVAVGLGCHVKMMRAKYPDMFLIGLLCHHLPDYRFTEHLGRLAGAKCIYKVRYRGNGWPGYVKVNETEMPHLDCWTENYISERCKRCKQVSYDADIVCGDPWRINQPNKTLILSRTARATKEIEMAKDYLSTKEISLDTFRQSQEYHFKRKLL